MEKLSIQELSIWAGILTSQMEDTLKNLKNSMLGILGLEDMEQAIYEIDFFKAKLEFLSDERDRVLLTLLQKGANRKDVENLVPWSGML